MANRTRTQAAVGLKARRARARATANAGRLPLPAARDSLGRETWSCLQTRLVEPSVLALYEKLYDEFMGFVSAGSRECTLSEALDEVRVDILDWLFAEGRQTDSPVRLIAAVPFHRPGVAALGSRALARARSEESPPPLAEPSDDVTRRLR